jgi:protein-tyrosine-phosphatase
MSYSEKVFLRIREISREQDIDIVEATSVFCEEQDMDALDFVKMVDKNLLEQLKCVAIENRKVRQLTAKRVNKLPI